MWNIKEYLSAERLLTNCIFYCKFIVIKEKLNTFFVLRDVLSWLIVRWNYVCIHEYDMHEGVCDQIENLNTIKGKAYILIIYILHKMLCTINNIYQLWTFYEVNI